jgi:hypothetical protein
MSRIRSRAAHKQKAQPLKLDFLALLYGKQIMLF